MKRKSKTLNHLVIGILFLPTLGVLGFRAVKAVQFEQNCSGRLKRAADASTIELAQQELDAALSYIYDKHLTTGYTSIIYQTPDEDVGFWCNNLKAAADNLRSVKSETTTLEKSNILLKLRQTLLDHSGKQGETVTLPSGISIHPYNGRWFVLLVFSLLLALVAIFLLLGGD